MRKRIIGSRTAEDQTRESHDWLDLESLARAELSSEDPSHPIEAAIGGNGESGWRAADPGAQTVRLLFDAPIRVRHIQLLFRESEARRTQEFVLSWRTDTEKQHREIVRQQYHFSPPHSTEELENYAVDLDGLTELELTIIPDISGEPVRASLARMRLA
ncbi:MAG: hypothetical protein J5I92_01605 [Thiogranum sp.]|nr:hypothetical protein [Thiogranum sp.]